MHPHGEMRIMRRKNKCLRTTEWRLLLRMPYSQINTNNLKSFINLNESETIYISGPQPFSGHGPVRQNFNVCFFSLQPTTNGPMDRSGAQGLKTTDFMIKSQLKNKALV